MLQSGLPEDVADLEPLLRFLTSDSQFNTAVVKPSGFMPGPADAKTSVFRQAATPSNEVWALADREIAAPRRAKAAATLTAADVRRAKLDVEAHEPPHRHANIAGWPVVAADADETRAKQKQFALLLTQAAKLMRRT